MHLRIKNNVVNILLSKIILTVSYSKYLELTCLVKGVSRQFQSYLVWLFALCQPCQAKLSNRGYKTHKITKGSSRPGAMHKGDACVLQTEGTPPWDKDILEKKGIWLRNKEPGSSSTNCLTDICLLISVLPSVVAAAKLGSGEPCSGILSTSTSPSCLRLIPRSVEPCRIGDPGMLKSASLEKSKPSGIQHIIFQCFATLFLNIATQAGK